MSQEEQTPIVDENHIIAERREKLAQLRKNGVAFPNDFVPTHHAADLHEHYGEISKEHLAEKNITVKVAGRMSEEKTMNTFVKQNKPACDVVVQCIYKLAYYALYIWVFATCIFLSTRTVTSIINKPSILIANETAKNNNFTIAVPIKKAIKVLEPSLIIKGIKEKHSHDLKNETYANLIDQTMIWIKKHEPTSQFATYQEEKENESYKIADKLLIRAIFSNYQLKRDLLNQKLAKASNLKEALDYLLKSEELEQIKQYEKWTKEFLQTHPQNIDTTLLEDPIIY